MNKQRLQKLLAQAGYGSRRSAEKMIIAQRIKINNKIAKLGDKVDLEDIIKLDNKKIDLNRFKEAATKVLIMNKQAGIICSRKDPKGRKSIYELLPKNSRWVMVGRLDINTSGLIIFTTNGELANRLMHPSYEIKREYMVRVLGNVKKEHLQKLSQGVMLNNALTKFDKIKTIDNKSANKWFKVTLSEGKYREIRRLWEILGFKVNRLIRISYSDIKLPKNLASNKFQYLKSYQIKNLMNSVDLKNNK